ASRTRAGKEITWSALRSDIGYRISRHEDRAFQTHALGSMQLGMTDINSQWSIARRMRPDEHAVWISAVPRDIRLQPLNHRRYILAAVVPVLARVALHGHADHVVLHGPSPDVVVKRIRLAVLLFDLVASAAGDVNQDRAIPAALVRAEDIHQVLRMRTKRHV